MTLPRYAALVVLLALGLSGTVLAQTAKTKCGPDHAILYKRAVGLLEQAGKKLNATYTAEG